MLFKCTQGFVLRKHEICRHRLEIHVHTENIPLVNKKSMCVCKDTDMSVVAPTNKANFILYLSCFY